MKQKFSAFAKLVAEALGTWQAFAVALALILIWFVLGFRFGFSNQLYQLVINTGTTIVTFLMVFLLQQTQNRDAMATHIKLDELVHAVRGASDNIIRVEDLTDDELKMLRERRQRGEADEPGSLE